MRWDYGKIYQKIRKSKGMTQEEVCGDYIARSTLARIESGQVIPRFDTMLFLLHQIDMSLEEFQYICNLYEPSTRQQILNAVYSTHSIVGTKDLEELQQLCQNYLKIEHDIPIEHILDILNIVILIRKKGIFQQSEKIQHYTQKIWFYLEKQDTWYENDIRLLSTIIYHFQIDTINTITPKILDNLTRYKNFHNIKSAQIVLLTNISTIYLHNNLKKDCETVSSLILELSKELKRYDSLAYAQVRIGICRGDDDLINKGMALLQLAEENELIRTLEKEIKNYR